MQNTNFPQYIDDVSVIHDLIVKSCRAKLEIKLKIGNKVYPSYFIDLHSKQNFAVIDRIPRNHKPAAGSRVEIFFNIIYAGLLVELKMNTVLKKTGKFLQFPSFTVSFPEKITVVSSENFYKIVPPEVDSGMCNLFFGDAAFPQTIFKIGYHEIQFYFDSTDKSMRKKLFVGKIFDYSELVLPEATIPISGQINSFEAGTIIMRFSLLQEEHRDYLQSYLQNIYLQNSLRLRFGWEILSGSPIQKKRNLGRKKILLIENDLNFHLAIKEFLSQKGFHVTSVMEKVNILQIATNLKPDIIIMNMELPWSNTNNIALELKHNKITKNVPIIFIADSNQNHSLAHAIQLGGVELLHRPLNLTKLFRKVNVGLQMREDEIGNSPVKLLLIAKENKRMVFQIAEWALGRKLQVILGNTIKSFPREALLKNINIIIVNSNMRQEKYIMDTARKLHAISLGHKVPVFIIDPVAFDNKIVTLNKLVYGIPAVSPKTLEFIDAVISKIIAEM